MAGDAPVCESEAIDDDL